MFSSLLGECKSITCKTEQKEGRSRGRARGQFQLSAARFACYLPTFDRRIVFHNCNFRCSVTLLRIESSGQWPPSPPPISCGSQIKSGGGGGKLFPRNAMREIRRPRLARKRDGELGALPASCEWKTSSTSAITRAISRELLEAMTSTPRDLPPRDLPDGSSRRGGD